MNTRAVEGTLLPDDRIKGKFQRYTVVIEGTTNVYSHNWDVPESNLAGIGPTLTRHHSIPGRDPSITSGKKMPDVRHHQRIFWCSIANNQCSKCLDSVHYISPPCGRFRLKVASTIVVHQARVENPLRKKCCTGQHCFCVRV